MVRPLLRQASAVRDATRRSRGDSKDCAAARASSLSDVQCTSCARRPRQQRGQTPILGYSLLRPRNGIFAASTIQVIWQARCGVPVVSGLCISSGAAWYGLVSGALCMWSAVSTSNLQGFKQTRSWWRTLCGPSSLLLEFPDFVKGPDARGANLALRLQVASCVPPRAGRSCRIRVGQTLRVVVQRGLTCLQIVGPASAIVRFISCCHPSCTHLRKSIAGVAAGTA